MALNIVAKDGPNILNPAGSQTTPQGPTARERAIAALLDKAQAAPPTQPRDIPVQNANAVSPEELSAIRPKLGQPSNNEGSQEPSAAPAPAEATTSKPEAPADPLSSHYAQLARKERAIRAKAQAQEQAIKAKEAQLKAQEEALKAKEAQYQTGYVDKSKLQQDPLTVLNELGLTYDQLTNLVLNAPKPEEIAQKQAYDKLQSEIKALRDAQEQAQKAAQDQQTQAYQQALNQIRQEAKSLVNSDPEFSVIKSTNSVDDVVELIEKVFEKDGVLLTVDEAAREVESFLAEEATKLWKIEKIRKMVEAPSKPAQATAQASNPPKQAPAKTLTNAVSSSRPLSAKERAVLAFKGELK